MLKRTFVVSGKQRVRVAQYAGEFRGGWGEGEKDMRGIESQADVGWGCHRVRSRNSSKSITPSFDVSAALVPGWWLMVWMAVWWVGMFHCDSTRHTEWKFAIRANLPHIVIAIATNAFRAAGDVAAVATG